MQTEVCRERGIQRQVYRDMYDKISEQREVYIERYTETDMQRQTYMQTRREKHKDRGGFTAGCQQTGERGIRVL